MYVNVVHFHFISEINYLPIPRTMRSEIRSDIHQSHVGIEGCLRRARESVFWPGMNSQIKEWIQSCETCRKFECSQQKETLMPHDVLDRSWEKVGMDLFTHDAHEYLVTVDYYSNFWEIDKLNRTTSNAVISKVKSHFARYGIPSTVMSDNGPQFASEEFARFAQNYNFEHVTSSWESRVGGQIG